MSKITPKSGREETEPRLRRKRRKKDFDSIHTRILKAKRKLDNVGKNKSKGEHRRRGIAKISSRLLPRPAAGIYRNGTKGKNVQKAEQPENTYIKARLEGDALKLFNGDTPESKYIIEDTKCDDTSKQLPNKEFVKNNLEWTPCTVEQSSFLSRRPNRNQKLCFVKKKGEENIFKDLDLTNIRKQDIIKKSKCTTQKEDICKRKLFQNGREQVKDDNITPIQIFDDTDFPKANKLDKKTRQQICSENNKDASWDPLNLYMELCARISAENFEADSLENRESDPLMTTIKKLRQIYADSYHQLRLHSKPKQELLNEELHTSSEDHQACTYSHDSQSSIEFENPRHSENQEVATHLQKSITERDDKFQSNPVQSGKSKKSRNAMQYGSMSYLSQNIAAVYGTSLITENCENNDKQYVKQPSIHHPSISLCFVNEKEPAHLDSQKNPNFVRHSSKDNHHVQQHVNIFSDTYSQCVKKAKYLQAPLFSDSSVLPAEKSLSKIRLHEKLSTKLVKDCEPSSTVSDECATNNVLRRYNDRTVNKCNMKDIRRVPTILRRCNNVTINKNSQHAQIDGDYTESLYKKVEANSFNENLSNVTKGFYETEFSNMFENFPAATVADIQIDRSKILEPQIGSMKIKDTQELEIKKYDVNLCPDKSNERNEFWQFDNFSEPTTLHNTNRYIEKFTQQHEVTPHVMDHHFHSNNNRLVNHLQSRSFSNLNVKPAKQFFQQANSQNDSCRHVRDTYDIRQELITKNTHDQSKNIFVDNVESRTMPMTLNHSQNTRTNKKPELFMCEEMIGKTNIEYIKERTNQNTRNCNQKYIYFDPSNCSHNCNVSHAYRSHEDTALRMAEPKISCDAKDCNSGMDNCVTLLNGVQNVQSLPLEYKRDSYTYPKVVNGHHRAMLLQDVTQPMKYLAVKNGPNIQKIPVYVNGDNVEITENVPLKVVTLMNADSQTNSFPQAITATQLIPLQTSTLRFNDVMYNRSNQPFAKHVNPVNAILFNSGLQPDTSWYSSDL